MRIGAVTTDLPLAAGERRREPSVVDFCNRCRKCADVCPSQAIPDGDREAIDGVRRWRIDQEACFTFWCRIGTDCARCVKACPYSHPDSTLHNLVRSGIRRSLPFRRLALAMDDLFYGKVPAATDPPDWVGREAG